MAKSPFVSFHHVQIAMPEGREEEARQFYVELLGMAELQKPSTLAKRGGAWFASDGVELHLGVELDFRPARKAHPALVCANYVDLVARLRAHGVDVRHDEPLARGAAHAFIDDPFGNRLELIETLQ